MAPQLRDLALLVATIDAGSISAGAEASGISLSSASSRLSALERTLEIPLLVRSRGGVSVTTAGALVERHARAVLTATARLETELVDHRLGLAARVRLASNTSALDTLTEFLAASLTRFSGLRVDLTHATSLSIVELVRAGDVDLGIVSVAPTDETGLLIHDLWADPLVIIRAPRHRDDDSRPPNTSSSFAETLHGPLIGLSEGDALQTLIDQEAQKLGVTPQYRVRLPTLESVHAVASTGAGAAIIPAASARRFGANPDSVHGMTEPWALRRARLLTRSDRPDGPVQTLVSALLRYRSEDGVLSSGARR